MCRQAGRPGCISPRVRNGWALEWGAFGAWGWMGEAGRAPGEAAGCTCLLASAAPGRSALLPALAAQRRPGCRCSGWLPRRWHLPTPSFSPLSQFVGFPTAAARRRSQLPLPTHARLAVSPALPSRRGRCGGHRMCVSSWWPSWTGTSLTWCQVRGVHGMCAMHATRAAADRDGSACACARHRCWGPTGGR